MRVPSNLERVLAEGDFAVTSELGPPQSADGQVVRKKTKHFRDFVDAVNITDNQTAIVRMSSIATATILAAEGFDTVIQVTCRDRNRIAIQSDILGAAALGVKNVLCLSGDHQSFGNHPGSKNVYDIDSIQLIAMIKNMRDESMFASGDEMKKAPELFIGAAANPFADPMEFRVFRLAKKVRAGADFIQTQAVFDLPRFRDYMGLVRAHGLDEKVAILAGIIPVRSARALSYMKSEVAGMIVPDELIRRMEGADDPKEEGVRIAVELIEQIREIEGVRGVHLMPVTWESSIPKVCEEAGLLPRPVYAKPSAGEIVDSAAVTAG